MSIVILAAEFSLCGTNGGRDKIFFSSLSFLKFLFWVLFNTAVPLAPALVDIANGLSSWRQGGVGLRGKENNGPSAWVSTISLPLLTPFSLHQTWPTNGSFALWRENTHTLQTLNTHTHTLICQEATKSVGDGWIVRQKRRRKKRALHGLLSVQMWKGQTWTINFNCSVPKRDLVLHKLLLLFIFSSLKWKMMLIMGEICLFIYLFFVCSQKSE